MQPSDVGEQVRVKQSGFQRSSEKPRVPPSGRNRPDDSSGSRGGGSAAGDADAVLLLHSGVSLTWSQGKDPGCCCRLLDFFGAKV